MPKSDIKHFIDYFYETTQKVRGQKAQFVRGKDGKLVQKALNIFSRQQLEMLALWFLANKKNMSPTIGAMLSSTVLEELQKIITTTNFWHDLDKLCEQYYSQDQYQIISSIDRSTINTNMLRQLTNEL